MIPWVREKFAERRAKWQATRSGGKRVSASEEKQVDVGVQVASTSSPATSTNSNGTHSGTNVGQKDVLKRTPRRSGRESAQRPSADATNSSQLASLECSSSSSAATPTHRLLVTPSPQQTRISKIKHSSRSNTSSSASCPESGTGSNSEDAVGLSRDQYRNGSSAPIKERIKVRIICPSARVLAFQTDVNKRLAELKNEIILELSDDPASMPLFATDVRQLSPRYRLFRADYAGVELNETLSLNELHINDNDTLILVGRRQQLAIMSTQTREIQSPREQEIELATRNIPARVVDMPMVDINEIFQQSNLQFDVRKVLISLAQASASIIGAGPYADRLIAMLKEKLINKRNYQNDTLQCLVDMGFKKETAEYALKIHLGVYSSALEWLIMHQSDEMTMEDAAMGMQKSQSIISPSGIITNNDIVENTEALIEIVRIYSHRDIPPSPETVGSLVEMGFDETEVLKALKKTCNNKAAACEWLCGNRSGSLIELRDGLSQDSPILKSILELPQVQMNLSNPKVLLAFLSILENENSIRVWGGDNDTTSVITHILQKYHEEKHILGINQFYSNR